MLEAHLLGSNLGIVKLSLMIWHYVHQNQAYPSNHPFQREPDDGK